MKEIHDIAEKLENRKLTMLRLCLSGFVLGGGARLIQAYLFSSEAYLVLDVLQIVGGVILLISLQQLWSVGRKVKTDKLLNDIFNDELTIQTKLKSRQSGFFAFLITQIAFIPISLFYNIDALLVAEMGLFVGVTAVLSMFIIQEELLAITLFSMDVDEEKYEVWNWRSLSFFHWIINPGVIIGELLLGQRAPKVMLIDKQSEEPFLERCYVPCPSCETVHSGMIWSAQNKTSNGNYHGLYCPECGEVIPCLRNAFSLILIVLTYPLWFWNEGNMKSKWLKKQPARFKNVNIEATRFENIKWKKMGIFFGVFMFLFMTFGFKAGMLLFGEEVSDYMAYFFDPVFLIVNAIVWPVAAWLFIYFLKRFMSRKGSDGGSVLTKKLL